MSLCSARRMQLNQQTLMVRKDISTFLRHEKSVMANLLKTVTNMHPDNVLKRGYSITRLNGKAVTRLDQLKESDMLETMLTDGSIISEVKDKKKYPAHE